MASSSPVLLSRPSRVHSWSRLRMFNGTQPAQPVSASALSPNGISIALVLKSGYLEVWDIRTDKRTFEPLIHWGTAPVCLSWSPDGKKLMISHNRDHSDNEMKISILTIPRSRANGDEDDDDSFHTKPWPEIKWLDTRSIDCMAWSPSGARIAAGSSSGRIRLWKVPRGQQRTRNWRLTGHGKEVLQVAWSPDEQTLASTSCDRTVRIWNAVTGACLHMFSDQCNGGHHFTWSPCGSFLAMGAASSFTVRIWDMQNSAMAKILDDSSGSITCRALAWSQDGRQLAKSNNRGDTCAWDVSGMRGGTSPYHPRYDTRPNSLFVWLPDGKQLIRALRAPSCLHGAVTVTTCLWNDRHHRLFSQPFKSTIFLLMCIRSRLDSSNAIEQQRALPLHLPLPRLPVEMWLEIFSCLESVFVCV